MNAADTIRAYPDRPAVVRDAADLLDRGLRHLRDVARATLEQNRFDRKGQPLATADFEDLKLLFAPETARLGQRLDWQTPAEGADLAWLPAAPVRQIVLNLCLNAAAAAGQGGAVGLEVVAAPEVLTLSVCDDGPGMSAEALRRLLGDGCARRRCRAAARARPCSQPWRADRASARGRLDRADGAVRAGGRAMLSGCRIALIEDDEIMGASLYQRLGLEGAEVIWLKQMRRALGALRTPRAPIDLVVCDIRLSDGTGEELSPRSAAPMHRRPFCSSPGRAASIRRCGSCRPAPAITSPSPSTCGLFWKSWWRLRLRARCWARRSWASRPPRCGSKPGSSRRHRATIRC